MGILAFSRLAQGVLTGKYRPGAKPPEGSRAADEGAAQLMTKYLQPAVLEAVEQLEALAGEAACSLAQFDLAWYVQQPAISSVIVGATREERLIENLGAVDTQVDSGLFARAVELLG
ncbi:MAG: hypothetical protein C4341_00070 [Armatimonadota bacterium]